jgi:hypothetical protein
VCACSHAQATAYLVGSAATSVLSFLALNTFFKRRLGVNAFDVGMRECLFRSVGSLVTTLSRLLSSLNAAFVRLLFASLAVKVCADALLLTRVQTTFASTSESI